MEPRVAGEEHRSSTAESLLSKAPIYQLFQQREPQPGFVELHAYLQLCDVTVLLETAAAGWPNCPRSLFLLLQTVTDVNSRRFAPDCAGQTCVCSCCLCSCWGAGRAAPLSKLPTCEVFETKNARLRWSHICVVKRKKRKKKIGTFCNIPKLRNGKNEE